MRSRENIRARVKKDVAIILDGERDITTTKNNVYYNDTSYGEFKAYVRDAGIVETYEEMDTNEVYLFTNVTPITTFLMKHLDKIKDISQSKIFISKTYEYFPNVLTVTSAENDDYKLYLKRILDGIE